MLSFSQRQMQYGVGATRLICIIAACYAEASGYIEGESLDILLVYIHLRRAQADGKVHQIRTIATATAVTIDEKHLDHAPVQAYESAERVVAAIRIPDSIQCDMRKIIRHKSLADL